MRRVVVALVVALFGFACMGIDRAAAETCSNCGDSDTTLHFYTPDDASSVTSVPYGQPFKMSASVLDISDSCGFNDCNWPSGKVSFLDNGASGYFTISPDASNTNYTPTSVYDGRISNFDVIVATLAPGPHSIKALYESPIANLNNPHHFNSSSDTQSITITQAETAITVSNGSPNPSSYGDPVVFTATVTPNPAVAADAATPTGNVVLKLSGDSTVYASGPLNSAGVATLTSTTLPVGTNAHLQAIYVGDTNYNAHGSDEVSQTVNLAPTSTLLTATPSPSSFGQAVLLTAQVTSSAATGTVTFRDGTTPLGTGTLSGGTATFSTAALTTGTHTLHADYGGDGGHAASTDDASHTVNKAATTTSVTSSPNPTKFGQLTTLTATVSPNTATGSVTFYDGTTSIGGGTLSLVGGVRTATLNRSGLSVGSHSLTAAYLGDENHETSTSLVSTHTVEQADTTTTLTGPSSPIDFGSSAPLSVVVAPVAPGAGVPTGTVTFTEGPTVLGTATLTNGAATFSAANLLPGTHTVSAGYGGDGNFKPSTSHDILVTVTCQKNQTAPVSGNMTIGAGSTCVTAPTVTGQIFIGPGARVFLGDAKVYGNITSVGASTIAICGTIGNGQLHISNTSGPVVLGDTSTRSCGPTKFGGAVGISGNHGGLTIVGNKFPSLDVSNNSAPAGTSNLVARNVMSGRFSCSGNTPPPTNGGGLNTAPVKWGQCASL